MPETFDALLQSQEEELASMRVLTAEVFTALQVDENEFIRLLHDKSRYTLEEWASLQKHRSMLNQALEARLAAATQKAGPKKQTPIAQHWMFVR